MDIQNDLLALVSVRKVLPGCSPRRRRSSTFGSSDIRCPTLGTLREPGATGTPFATGKKIASRTARRFVVRRRPPLRVGGNSGETSAHAASLRSVEYELFRNHQYRGTD